MQKVNEEVAFKHWLAETHKVKEIFEKLTGVKITEEKLREAIKLTNKERRLKREVASFAGKPLTGLEVLRAKSVVTCMPDDLKAYEAIIEQCKQSKGNSTAPRLLLTGVPQVGVRHL